MTDLNLQDKGEKLPIKESKVNTAENIIPFDVDETLVLADYQRHYDQDGDYYNKTTCGLRTRIFDYYGEPRERAINLRMVELLKAKKARGFYVRVWSANGYRWAEEVVTKLDLWDYVDSVETKPNVYFDDKGADEWMKRVWVK